MVSMFPMSHVHVDTKSLKSCVLFASCPHLHHLCSHTHSFTMMLTCFIVFEFVSFLLFCFVLCVVSSCNFFFEKIIIVSVFCFVLFLHMVSFLWSFLVLASFFFHVASVFFMLLRFFMLISAFHAASTCFSSRLFVLSFVLERMPQISIVLQDCKVARRALNCDIEIPFVVQWRMLWYFSQTTRYSRGMRQSDHVVTETSLDLSLSGKDTRQAMKETGASI